MLAVLSVVTLAGAWLVGVSASAPVTAVAQPTVRFGSITGFAGKCVDVFNANGSNGTQVQLWPCNGTNAQQWREAGDGTVSALGKCLDVNGGSTANGAKVQIWDCNGSAAQQWRHTPDQRLVNPLSGKCLDVTGASTADGTPLQTWQCVAGAVNQQWSTPDPLPEARAIVSVGTDGKAFSYDTTGWHGTTGQVRAGTSPAVATQSAGGRETAFVGTDGLLWKIDPGLYPTQVAGGLAVAPNTSPAIANASNPAWFGAWKIAFQGANGHLWTVDANGTVLDTGAAMRPGTSPSISGTMGAGYKIAFVGADGYLWKVDSAIGWAGAGLSVAPGTSPSIAADGGGYRIAFHALGDHLWTYDSSSGAADSSHLIKAGTSSPSIAMGPGGYWTAFVGTDGYLWRRAPNGAAGWAGAGLNVAPNTSPAIAADATRWQVAFHALGDHLWLYESTGRYEDTNRILAAGVSPAISGVIPTGGAAWSTKISKGEDPVPVLPHGVKQVAVGKLGIGGNVVSIDNYHPDDTCRCLGVRTVDDYGGKLHVVLMADGTVRAWGDNAHGEVGDGTTTPRTTPQPVANLTGVTQISVGYRYTLALKADGTVWTWGYHPPGLADSGNRTTPVQIPSPSGITQVAAGARMGLALTSDGRVWQWGGGQHDPFRGSPNVSASLSNVAQIAAGYEHAVALDAGGAVWAWGNSRNGQAGEPHLDDGSLTSIAHNPIRISGLPTPVTQIAAGFHASYAIAGGDNSVYAWGGNGFLDGLSPNDIYPDGHHDDVIDELGYVEGPTGELLTYTYDHDAHLLPLDVHASLRKLSMPPGAAQLSANYGTLGVVMADGTVWTWDINVTRTGNPTQETSVRANGATQIAIASAGNFDTTVVLAPPAVTVPDIKGMTASNATLTLKMAGLVPKQNPDQVVWDSGDGGKVVFVYPPVGAAVPLGTKVQFAIGLWGGANR